MVETNTAKAEEEADLSLDEGQDADDLTALGRERVDLTVQQAAVNDEDALDDMDDFDLLEATIDPTDVKSMAKRNKLEEEIAYEEIFIKSKLLVKMAWSEQNPMKIDE